MKNVRIGPAQSHPPTPKMGVPRRKRATVPLGSRKWARKDKSPTKTASTRPIENCVSSSGCAMARCSTKVPASGAVILSDPAQERVSVTAETRAVKNATHSKGANDTGCCWRKRIPNTTMRNVVTPNVSEPSMDFLSRVILNVCAFLIFSPTMAAKASDKARMRVPI